MDAPTESLLVVGYRKGLIAALKEMDLSFCVWSPKKSMSKSYKLLNLPFPQKAREIRQILRENFKEEAFTHVIAGTEDAVYPAEVARQVFNAHPLTLKTARRCNDKIAMKTFLQRFGVPMTPFLPSHKFKNSSFQSDFNWGWPVVSKARSESGGRGFELLHHQDQISKVQIGSEKRILEKFIDAEEISLECFIQGKEIQFANITDYFIKKHINLVPGFLSHELKNQVLLLGDQVVQALGIESGIVHIEVYLSSHSILFGEIALRPPGGYIMDLMQLAFGFDPWKAYISMVLGREFEFPERHSHYTSGIVLHPGQGDIERISGAELIANHPNTYKFKLKAKDGDQVHLRKGTGEDLGFILQRASSPKEILKAISFAQENLNFEMQALA